MTEQERKILERDAARVYPEVAFKMGKIVALDEVLSFLEDTVQDIPNITGDVLRKCTVLFFLSKQQDLIKEVTARYGG